MSTRDWLSRFSYAFLLVLVVGALAILATSSLLAQDSPPGLDAPAGGPSTEVTSNVPENKTPKNENTEKPEAEPQEEAGEDTAEFSLLDDVNTLWTCLAAFLVFFMQAGFALVEAGFTRAKNACNIIMKNLMDLSFGSLLFWLVGFGIMFGVNSDGGPLSGWFGTNNFTFDATSSDALASGNSVSFNWAFLLFQTVFCATAATIVSGAMAERTKFTAYLAYSIGICAIVYPVFGHWAWGSLFGEASKGWLENKGFYDFAGSTVVHSIGGWAALAGAIVIGPRIGKFTKSGQALPIPGHNIPMGALGVFILWLGWFGFNAGSTTAIEGGGFAVIAVVTNIAAAAGSIGAMFTSWIAFKKPDPSLALNGALAGLVAITAGCDVMSPEMAAVTGFLGGILVVGSVLFLDKLKIDDPVGAISVHGVCGAWGTLAVGIFGSNASSEQFLAQMTGVVAAFLWSFPVSLILFLVIRATIGLRVSEQEEIEGLDITEHGILAYPPVMVADTHAGTGHAPMGP